MDERSQFLRLIGHLSAARAAAAAGDWAQTRSVAELALELQPDNVEALGLLAEASRQLGDFESARNVLRKAIRQAGFLSSLHNALGRVELAAGDAHAAAEAFAEALARDPLNSANHHNLARAWVAADEPQAAAGALAAVLALAPDSGAAWADQIGVLRDSAWLESAAQAARRALAIDREDAAARWNQALLWLQSGQFARGFEAYEARWRHGPFAGSRRHAELPLIADKAVAGRRILVWCEQGLGDAIQFARYVPLLIEAGAEVVLEAPERLHRLLRGLEPAPVLIAQTEPPPPVDAAIAIGSLPAFFEGRIPARIPYLRAEADLVETWRGWLGRWPGRKIGIAWQGNPSGSIDRGRSIPLAAFAPLAALTDCTLIVLQKQHGMDQIEHVHFAESLQLPPNLDSGASAFSDTAALIASLDLVVTSDTSIAHLAGALGARTFLALKHVPDWRWLMAGDSSPWYPTLTLFRQNRRGAWGEVFSTIANAIGKA